MNDLQIFNNPKFGEIRMVEVDGTAYAVGIDVANILEYKEPHKAVSAHCRGGISYPVIDSLGRSQETKIITEGDIFRLIVKAADQSKNSNIKAKAEEVESWIFDEILPAIHKHGAYITPDTLEQMITSPEFGIKLLTALKAEQDKNKHLEAANSTLAVACTIMAPKADYFDELVDRNLLTNFRDTAKQLDVREKDFISYLVDKKFLYRDKKGKLMPYADKNTGLFEVKECFNEKTLWSGVQALVTPKGRETFRLLCLKSV